MGGALAENWERYWQDLSAEPGSAVWDTEDSAHAGAALPLIEEHRRAGLPVLDLGCGNGTQTVQLTATHERVIGLDLSPTAIARARERHAGSGVDFRVLDLLDGPAVAALHAELGDATAYSRGLLHQIPGEHKLTAARAIATLVGATGRAYVLELSPATTQALGAALATGEAAVPKMKDVLRHGITPAAWPGGGLPELLAAAGLAVLAEGETTMRTTDTLADGSPLLLPMTWAVLRRAEP
ncbi:SAM-dependent methyltransferase [Crossiella equi]|uniref:SAM-dependent methyltransferase n=1 Tax=Crossiella equi TaxID=130796 RepID=A0ABS5ANH7_9PSEU|nr:class I SAM-dependent methyltransferase [Crossiella equi]MBP2478126.1 SAM-dependent methyltransferase [Crossiella equi]